MDKEKTFLCVIIALVILLLCTTASTGFYKNKYERLVSENGTMFEFYRERATVLSDTINRAREEVGELGESLGKQRTSVAELRELLTEVRTRYEKMENLLNSVGLNDNNVWTYDSSSNTTDEGQISEE